MNKKLPFNKNLFHNAFLPVTVSALLSVASLGCGAEVVGEEEQSAQNGTSTNGETQARVVELLKAQGFDTDTLQFRDDGTVLVEDDISMNVQDILADAQEQTEKGYWVGQKADPTKTVYIASYSTFSNDWTWAILQAIVHWDDKSKFTFKFVKDNSTIPSGAQVIGFKLASLSSCTFAESFFPSGGKTNGTVKINSSYNCPGTDRCGVTSIEKLPYDHKVKVAVHEVGHALGFAHPGTSTYISGTAKSSTNYSSVMWQGCLGVDAKISGSLSSDDLLSISKIYP